MLDASSRLRKLPGFPGYEIDPDGTIYSSATNWRGNYWRGYQRRAVAAKRNPNSGYYYVRMTDSGGTRRAFRLHVLMATIFHGKKPGPKYQVRHLDGNKANNAATNLKWGTAKDNAEDRERHGTVVKGEKCHLSRLKEQDIAKIRELVNGGITYAEIGRRYGMTYNNISCIARRITWKHIA